ncbi:MAG: nucleoside-triphosphatase [Acidobacteriota bacterium]
MNPDSPKNKAPHRGIVRFLLLIWTNFDTILSIGLSVLAAWFATFGGKPEYAVGATATALGIVAFGTLKDRAARDQIFTQLRDVEAVVRRLLDKTVADDFFSRKSSERDLIIKADKELVLVQETGRLIAETCRQELLAFVRRGGRLRWVAVADSNYIAGFMAFRNANLITPDLMIDRMQSGLRMIEILANEAGDFASNIEVRFFPYPVDITVVIRDPRHISLKDREALVRLQGFQVTFDDKLDFALNAYDSRTVYDLYLKQVENIWRLSSKCLFLTGEPGVGKSTLLEKAVCEIRNRSSWFEVVGFFTREIRNGSERIGFETVTVDGQHIGQLALKTESGTYELNSATMKELVLPAIDKGLAHRRALLIVDEIGPIQLQNPEFQRLMRIAMEDTSLSILGIVAAKGHSFLGYIHHHIRSRLISVTEINRDSLLEQIIEEFVPRQAGPDD